MFEGFRDETMQFLWGVRLNNERSWFLEHKTLYEEFLYRPLKELGACLLYTSAEQGVQRLEQDGQERQIGGESHQGAGQGTERSDEL